ncbi:hypothetical protein SSX86_016665 [Deinandra increscens subsp. villosa]|uniref:Uncharacterized protein n=1 Tax=Deinandra increscens subsp. villosa TaxID=3103831 RepID=A0AAP0D3T0_9ASTR
MVVAGSPSGSHHGPEDPSPTEPEQSETLDVPNPPQSPLPDLVVQNSQQSDEPPTNPQRRRNKPQKRRTGKIRKSKWLTKKMENLTDVLNPIPFTPKALDLDKYEDVLSRLGLYSFSKIELDRSIRTDLLVQLIVNYDPKKRCSYVNDKRIKVNRADLVRALKLPGSKQDKRSHRVDLDSEVFSDEAIGFIEDFVFNWMLLHEESWVMPAEIVNWTRCIRDGHPEKLDPGSLIWYKVEKELIQGEKLVDCYYASHLQCLIRSQQSEFFKEEDEGEEIVKADEEKEEKVFAAQEDDVGLTLGPDVVETVHQEVRKDDETMVDAEERKEEEEEMEEQEEKEEHDEKVFVVQEDDAELSLGPDVEKIVHQEVRKDDETMVDVEECKEEEMGEQVNWKNGFSEAVLQRCQSSDLNDYEENKVEDEEIERVEDEEHVDEEVEDEEIELVEDEDDEENKVEEVEDEHIEQVDDEDDEENKVEEVEDEQIERVEDEDDEENKVEEGEDEQIERVEDGDDEENKVEEVEDEQIEQVEDEDDEGDGERFVEGFDMEANDDFHQGVETSNIPYGSHGVSTIDLFRSRDDSFMSLGGPSFFDNGGKREMESEEDIHHPDGNSKRLKIDGMWDQEQNDFGACMGQMQQWMEKAKMIHLSKEESFVNSQCRHDLEMNQLEQSNHIMEMLIKSKDEQLTKKHAEVLRLEHELYLMGDLLAGYRKALNDTRFKFSEYRRRFALQEKPLYKDAGPGGLVLSTQELEKQRLKQQEDMMKFQTLAKSFEEECVYQLKIQDDRVLKMAEKLVSVGNEVKRLKEIATQCKETRKPRDELKLSPEPEEDQKSLNEDLVNDASTESIHPDADESKLMLYLLQEKEGGEEG